jgi:Mn-dependent DtxR family transcriptional regulator
MIEFLFYLNRPIIPGDLSNELQIKHSTLNSVLKRLQEEGMINWEKYRNISLTEKGIETGKHLTQYHLILERFLSEVLGMESNVAHSEALDLSPHVSYNLIKSICEKLGISHNNLNRQFCKARNYLCSCGDRNDICGCGRFSLTSEE